ncbi:hypothetical protein [Candidatus Villigracilis saccharophilus]|uniref:hypothetical protein n=1 Tax=Candidatus Villigracilis saccharophilus TaxID=3140684 RepID=UPI00313573F4|nr:hypothetical protein [Anaerolineales bacterium]
MRTQTIRFPNQQALCVFPDQPSDLVRAVSELGLDKNYPVIVLIGGNIDEEQAVVTRLAIHSIARAAEDMNALIVCGGTNMGLWLRLNDTLAKPLEISLVGITLEDLVTGLMALEVSNFYGGGKSAGN